MKKTLMTLAAVLCCVTTMLAEPVSPSVARQTAAKFLQGKGAVLKSEAMRAKSRAMGHRQQTEASPYYVFNAKASQGFVIVSGDDCVGDNLVLGYTPQGSFETDAVPANMQWWLDETASQIAELSRLGLKARAVATHEDVPYLVTALWNQGDNYFNPQNPYNGLCPATDGLLCLTGCMSTALSQVMYYHRWPQGPIAGELPAYTMANGRAFDALAPVAFDWDNMVDDYTQPTTEGQQVAVALLMRYCGQLLQMDYTPWVSNGFIYDTDLLTNVFGYDAGVHSARAEDYSPSGWDELLYNELKEGRPLIYGGQSTGGGHAFVVDGYEVRDGSGYFHVNWGWGGGGNGYFKINVLNPYMSGAGGSSTKDGFSRDQSALIGLQPAKTPTDSYHRYVDSFRWNMVGDDGSHTFFVANPSYQPGVYDIALAELGADGTADCSQLFGGQTLKMAGYSYGGFNTEEHTGRGSFTIPGNVAEGLAPGNHKLVFVNRESGSDAPWKPVFGPNCYIELTVDGEGQPTETIFHPMPQLSCTQKNIKIDGLKQCGIRQHVVATVANKGEDFVGSLECAVYYVEDSKLQGLVHFSRAGIMAEGDGTGEAEFFVSTNVIGNHVLVITKDGEDLTGRTLSDVKKVKGYVGHRTFSIEALAFYCHNFVYRELTNEESHVGCLDISVTNSTPLDYNAVIVARLYKLGEDGAYSPVTISGETQFYNYLTVASNGRQTVSIMIPEALEPGEYGCDLLVANDFQSNDPNDYFVFDSRALTVNAATGIKSIDNGQLTIDNSVYDLQGRRVDSSKFKVQSSKLKKGIYVRNGKKFVVR